MVGRVPPYASLTAMSFAVVDRTRQGTPAVLVIIDERDEAEAIAIELRQRGVEAEVRRVPGGGVWPRHAG